MLSDKTRMTVGGAAAAQGLAGHQSVGGEQLFSFASLNLGFIYPFLLFSFLLQFIIFILFYFNY